MTVSLLTSFIPTSPYSTPYTTIALYIEAYRVQAHSASIQPSGNSHLRHSSCDRLHYTLELHSRVTSVPTTQQACMKRSHFLKSVFACPSSLHHTTHLLIAGSRGPITNRHSGSVETPSRCTSAATRQRTTGDIALLLGAVAIYSPALCI